jgi:hypothetical protein
VAHLDGQPPGVRERGDGVVLEDGPLHGWDGVDFPSEGTLPNVELLLAFEDAVRGRLDDGGEPIQILVGLELFSPGASTRRTSPVT